MHKSKAGPLQHLLKGNGLWHPSTIICLIAKPHCFLKILPWERKTDSVALILTEFKVCHYARVITVQERGAIKYFWSQIQTSVQSKPEQTVNEASEGKESADQLLCFLLATPSQIMIGKPVLHFQVSHREKRRRAFPLSQQVVSSAFRSAAASSRISLMSSCGSRTKICCNHHRYNGNYHGYFNHHHQQCACTVLKIYFFKLNKLTKTVHFHLKSSSSSSL